MAPTVIDLLTNIAHDGQNIPAQGLASVILILISQLDQTEVVPQQTMILPSPPTLPPPPLPVLPIPPPPPIIPQPLKAYAIDLLFYMFRLG